MSVFNYILRSLWYFKKQHIAILFGSMLSTAILTGALIVGDSVNHSLNQIVHKRLGNIEYAMLTGDRFVQDHLSGVLSDRLDLNAAPVLSLEGIAVNPERNLRVNKSFVYGIDSTFWSVTGSESAHLTKDEAFISSNLAQKLSLTEGDEFLLRVENADFIPVNSPFIEDEQPSVTLRLSVKKIVDADQMGRFSLKSNQVAPDNVFISLAYLSEQFNLTGFSNTILIEGDDSMVYTTDNLNNQLRNFWTIEDAGLIIKELSDPPQFEISSKRIFMDEPIVQSLSKFSKNEKILTYLVNSMRFNNKSTPYSFVTASDLLINGTILKENEITINQWLADDLGITLKDTMWLDYFTIGPLRTLVEETSYFIVKEIVGTATAGLDNSLMPAFPGLADANSCSDWETSIPIDLKRIRDKDEKYWNLYKGTPKAYISLEKGIEIWGSSFGSYTAMRFHKNGLKLADFKKQLIEQIKPIDIGLQFIPVREMGSDAANNGVGFGELFISLSFFVILAGILLTALLYSLNTESRKMEIGLLSALGFSKQKILRIRFLELSVVAIIGGIGGAFLGILYNRGILAGIQSVWSDIVRTNDLEVFIKPSTIMIGAVSGIIIALLVVFRITIKKLKRSSANLLKDTISDKFKIKSSVFWNRFFAWVALGGSLALILISAVGSQEMNPGIMMTAGGLFLFGSLLFVKLTVFNSSQTKFNISSLSFKNASLNQGRSMAVIALLALGSFTILITGANRKTFYGVDETNSSGTGGYQLWAETSIPILNDLNTDDNPDVRFLQFHNLAGDDASCLNLNLVQKPQILGVNSAAFDSKGAFSFAKLSKGIDKDHPWLALTEKMDDQSVPAYVDQTVLTWGLKKKVGDSLIYLSENGKRLSLVIKGGLNSSIFQGNVLIDDVYFRKYFPSLGGSKIMLVEAESNRQAEIEEELNNKFIDYGIEVTSTAERLAEFNSVTNTYLTVFMVLGGLGVLIGTIGLGIVLLRNLLDRRFEIALMQSLGFPKPKILRIIFVENFVLLIMGLLIGSIAAFIGILPSIFSASFSIQGNFVFLILLIIFISGTLWIYIPARLSLKKYLIQSLSGE